jgi:hypothetical protein
MAEPTKQETDQVFKVLKVQKANKASLVVSYSAHLPTSSNHHRHVSTAMLGTLHGPASLSASISVWIARACIEIWVSTSALSGKCDVRQPTLLLNVFTKIDQSGFLAVKSVTHDESRRKRIGD